MLASMGTLECDFQVVYIKMPALAFASNLGRLGSSGSSIWHHNDNNKYETPPKMRAKSAQ